MSTSPAIDKNDSALGERRSCPRERPDSVVLLFFEEHNWAKLIDLNEKGMCIEYAHPPTLSEPINFTFEAMGSVPGQVKWIREFERTAGVLFLDPISDQVSAFFCQISLKTSKVPVRFGSEWISQSAAEIPPSAGPETQTPSQGHEAIASTANVPDRPIDEATDVDLSCANFDTAVLRRSVPASVPRILEVSACGPNGELHRRERQIGYEVSALNWRWRRTASMAALVCLAVLGFAAGLVRNVLKLTGVRAGAESARSGSGRKVPNGRAIDPLAARSPYPFLAEVIDTGNRVWVLRFDDARQNPSGQMVYNLPLMASPPIARNGTPAKQESAQQNRQTAHHFNLVSPRVRPRGTNASVANSAAPVPPGILGQTSASLEMPAGPMRPATLIPAPAEALPPLGGDVQPARLIRATRPVYPERARANRVEGDVTLSALIDAGGHPKDIKVLSGPLLLRQAAMEAVREWKYEAARLDGKPTAMSLTVKVVFRLN